MTLTVPAVNTGCVIGFHKPALTYMRGWGASMDVPLIMFVIEGGGAQIIVDTGGDVARAWEHHGFRMEQGGRHGGDAYPGRPLHRLDPVRGEFHKIEGLDCEVIPSHDVRVLRRRISAEERPQYSD